jgi:hypothetical protein
MHIECINNERLGASLNNSTTPRVGACHSDHVMFGGHQCGNQRFADSSRRTGNNDFHCYLLV